MKRFTILLVDDEERILNFLKTKLKLLSYEVILAADLQMLLPPNQGETHAQFQEEFLDVLRQSLLQLPLARFGGKREEIERVRVFQHLLRQVRLLRRQRLREVRDCLAHTSVRLRLDLHR